MKLTRALILSKNVIVSTERACRACVRERVCSGAMHEIKSLATFYFDKDEFDVVNLFT